MPDASHETDSLYLDEMNNQINEIWNKVPPAERLRIGGEIFTTAKKRAMDEIRQEMGHDDPKEMRRRLFLRFYGTDFTPEETERILQHLEQVAPV